MPSYSLIASRARDVNFEHQVRAALMMRARTAYVAGEQGVGEGTTPPAEYSYARSVLRDPQQYSGIAAWAVATDPLVIDKPMSTAITDADLETAVNRSWPVLATLA